MKNKKKELLSEKARQQNEEPHIKCLREFMRSSQALEKHLDSKLGGSALNRTQRRLVMLLLYKNTPMTPTELSKITFSSIDTVNKSLDTLDKMGLTRSYRSSKDRRVRKVTLTEKGLDVIDEFLPLRYQAFSKILTCFSEEEVHLFFDLNVRLSEQISRLNEQAPPDAPSAS